VYHQFVIQVPERDRVGNFLTSRQIGWGIHYPTPVHRMPAYAFLGYGAGSLPVTESLCQRILSLPMYPELTDDDVAHVASAIAESLCA
jgi:dTDP-4-amino-4,6-dideoxygalactose transaminase